MAACDEDPILELVSTAEETEQFVCTEMFEAGDSEQRGKLSEQGNENTLRVTKAHISLFKIWLTGRNDHREPEIIPPHELDSLIAHFLSTVHKRCDNSSNTLDQQYEPQTLRAIHSSICRYLRHKNYLADIKQDEVFRHSREVLVSKMKELKLLGKGKCPRASQPLTNKEICILIEKDILGTSEFMVHDVYVLFQLHCSCLIII